MHGKASFLGDPKGVCLLNGLGSREKQLYGFKVLHKKILRYGRAVVESFLAPT